jgi:GTP-binding protein EngB required for normal cell division
VTPILVATKIDKLPASKRKPAVAALKRDVGRPVIAYSSVTGDGRDALWKRLLSVSSIDRPDAAAPA